MSSCLTSTLQYLQHHKYLVCTETMAFLHSNIIYFIHYNLSIVSDHYIFFIVEYLPVCVGLTKLQSMLLHWHYICRFSPLQTSFLKY